MEFPSVTEILSDAGIGFNMSHLPEEYSDRGTLIHLYAANRMLELETPMIPEKWEGYARAVDKFQDESDIEPLLVEAQLNHKNMGITGHPDLIGVEKYEPCIWDYKTGSIPLYTGPQLAGYELLVKTRIKTYRKYGRYAVLLKPNGKYSIVPFENSRAHDDATFLEAYYGYLERRGIKWTFR